MRILFLSFYYEPDLSAGSFRSTALVKALSQRLGGDGTIDVLTTHPNRYQSFKVDAPSRESTRNVNIVRFHLPRHKNGFIDQAKSFIAYAFYVIQEVKGKDYDLVIASSSRLMTAVLASSISRCKKTLLYLDVRDIFVDTIQYVLGGISSRILLPFFRVLERYAISKAQCVNLVSKGFLPYFVRRYPQMDYRFISNGIDEEFLKVDKNYSSRCENKPIIVVYAGNIGEGQGLHHVVPELAKATLLTHEFWVVGDGGCRELLLEKVQGLSNVKIFSPLTRKGLIKIYKQADILFLHLNNYEAFKKVIPSKIFEYAALGKPVLSGVSGYASEFCSGIEGVAVFPPCDVEKGLHCLYRLGTGGIINREKFIDEYRRETLMQRMAEDIIMVSGKPLK
ncbi:glycosyltransferase family 4 protein [Thalassospira xiamenensis]|uniref:glycosyltransferase family 4 protein n=1 Tax=Thalassospira xiamenensis TaxID=220697 RepID=UPI001FFF9705|nr:glycosyltransferase family 4 protein [Thalassospira xiamenensis]MCK2167704.1 glycosyltransferase family 4 protein [Thalassospira xiamenensis]